MKITNLYEFAFPSASRSVTLYLLIACIQLCFRVALNLLINFVSLAGTSSKGRIFKTVRESYLMRKIAKNISIKLFQNDFYKILTPT